MSDSATTSPAPSALTSRRLPPLPWLETGGLALCALVAWIIVLSGGSRPDAAPERPLLASLPTRCRVVAKDLDYRLLLSHEPPLIADAQGRIRGRLRPDDSADIIRHLTAIRILRRLDSGMWDASDPAAYGLDDPVTLHIDDHPALIIGSIGGTQAYLRNDDGSLLIISPDPTPVLRRPVAALRRNTLDLPSPPTRVRHSRGWSLHRRPHTWLLRDEGAAPRHADEQLVSEWLEVLSGTSAEAFIADPGTPPRVEVLFTGRDDHIVQVRDFGPGPDERGRLIGRRQVVGDQEVNEFFICNIPAAYLDPHLEALASSRLLPVDPRTATRILLPHGIDLRRRRQGWSLADHDDGDSETIRALVEQLATLPRPDDDGSQQHQIIAWHGDETTRISLTRLPRLLEDLRPHDLRDRRLLPAFDPDTVIGLVIQPSDAPPEFYHRQDQSAAWPEDEAEHIDILLSNLSRARVTTWDGDASLSDGRIYDCTFIISDIVSDDEGTTRNRTTSLRMMANGRVSIPERRLSGTLNERSREEIVGE